MKSFFYLLLAMFLTPILTISAQSTHSYIGTDGCGMCHKTENTVNVYTYETMKMANRARVVFSYLQKPYMPTCRYNNIIQFLVLAY